MSQAAIKNDVSDTRVGSSKIVRAVNEKRGLVSFEFTDHCSAFDVGPHPQAIAGKGEALCACTVKSFELAGQFGPSHYVEQANERTIVVKEMSVPDSAPLSGKSHGQVIPLEWIWRTKVFGSLYRRLKDGQAQASDFGLDDKQPIVLGMALPQPIVECTTKFEAVDRHLSDDEAKTLANLSDEQWQTAKQLVRKAVTVTNEQFEKAGFISPDGKLELGLDNEGQILIVDVFGSPDESRIIDKTAFENGEIEHYDKELLRNYLVDEFDYYNQVKAARKANKPVPAYPELSDAFISLMSGRYQTVAKRYA